MSEFVRRLLDDLHYAFSSGQEPPAPGNTTATGFAARNYRDHIVVYHGDEAVMKIQTEHADDLVAALVVALKKRRGEYVADDQLPPEERETRDLADAGGDE